MRSYAGLLGFGFGSSMWGLSALLLVTLVASQPIHAQEDDDSGFSFGEDDLGEQAEGQPDAASPEGTPEDEEDEDDPPDSDDPDGSNENAPPGDEADSGEVDAEEDTAEATELNQADRIKAVSRKTFLKRHRFYVSPMAGTTVNDSFFRHYLVGGSAGFHLVENLSIEVSGAYNVFTERLPPVDFLRKNGRIVPEEAVFFGHAEVGAAFTPLYGKFAVFREWIIQFDGYIAGGLGVVIESGQEIPLYPAANLGVGGRVFILPWLVARADLRDYAYAQKLGAISTLQNLLVFSMGISIYFPFDFAYENEAFRVVDAG